MFQVRNKFATSFRERIGSGNLKHYLENVKNILSSLTCEELNPPSTYTLPRINSYSLIQRLLKKVTEDVPLFKLP